MDREIDKNKNLNKKILFIVVDVVIAAVLIVLDQVIKSNIVKMFQPNIVNGSSTISEKFIPGVVSLRYIQNYGSAWSMFSNKTVFLIIISIIFMLVVGYVIVKLPLAKKFLPSNILLSMIVAGGIGNMIDRIKQGYVVDYLWLDFWQSYPIFNFADICVVLGVIGIFIMFLFVYKDKDLEFLRFKKRVEKIKDSEENTKENAKENTEDNSDEN